ncbi:hypothetical protein MY11210_009612 [Beauveria gryllotalpidicola]
MYLLLLPSLVIAGQSLQHNNNQEQQASTPTKSTRDTQPGYLVTKALFDLARQDTIPAWDEIKPSIVDSHRELLKAKAMALRAKAQEQKLAKAQEQKLAKAQYPKPAKAPEPLTKAQEPEPIQAPEPLTKAQEQELVKVQEPEPLTIKGNFPEPPEVIELVKAANPLAVDTP